MTSPLSLTADEVKNIVEVMYSGLRKSYSALFLYGGERLELNSARRLVFDDRSTQKLAPFVLIYRNSDNIWQIDSISVEDYTKIIESGPLDVLPANLFKLKIPQFDLEGNVIPNEYIKNVEDFRFSYKLPILLYPEAHMILKSSGKWKENFEKYLPEIPDSSHSISIETTDIVQEIIDTRGQNYFEKNFSFLLNIEGIKLLGPYNISYQKDSINYEIPVYYWDLDINKKYRWRLDDLSTYVESYLKSQGSVGLVLAHIDDKFQAADSLGRKMRPSDGSKISKLNTSWVLEFDTDQGFDQIVVNSFYPISQLEAGIKLIAELTENVDTNNYYVGITGFGNLMNDVSLTRKLFLQDSKFPPHILVNPFFNEKSAINRRVIGNNWYHKYVSNHQNILWDKYKDLGYSINLDLLSELIEKHPVKLSRPAIDFIVNLFNLSIEEREICFFKSLIRDIFGDHEVKIHDGTAFVSYKVINQLNYLQEEKLFEALDIWFQKRSDRKYDPTKIDQNQRKLYSSSSNVASGTGTIKEIFKPIISLIPDDLKLQMKKFEKMSQPWSKHYLKEFNQLNRDMIKEILNTIKLIFHDFIRDLIPKEIG